MACELWVTGGAENGGPVQVNVKMSDWGVNRAFPVLTQVSTGQSQGRTYQFFSAVPAWPFGTTGWYGAPSFYVKGDCGISPNQKYDCLNGNCIPSVTHGTPGAFANLASCTSGCAKNSNCLGECVPPAELAALKSAIDNLQSKHCN